MNLPKWVAVVFTVIAIVSICVQAARSRPTQNHPNIISVPDDDVEMNRAIAEAQTKLGQFIDKATHLKPDEMALLKFQYKGAEMAEYVWLVKVRVTGDKFQGTLADDTYANRDLKPGMPFTVGRSDVSDWCIARRDGSRVGCFTQKVLDARTR